MSSKQKGLVGLCYESGVEIKLMVENLSKETLETLLKMHVMCTLVEFSSRVFLYASLSDVTNRSGKRVTFPFFNKIVKLKNECNFFLNFLYTQKKVEIQSY